MQKLMLIVLTLGLTLTSVKSWAGSEDDDMQNAIQETQKVLNDRDQRRKLYQNDDAAKGANSMAQDAVGGDNAKLDEIYAISGELIPFLAKEANGDPLVMLKILEEAKGNPQKFYQRFPAEQQAKVRALVDSIDKSKGGSQSRP